MHTPETRKTALKKLHDRRKSWIAANGPCRACGSGDRLCVSFIDPATKVSTSIWSLREANRIGQLAKCQVLCYGCCREKSNIYLREKFRKHGVTGYRRGCTCKVCREAGAANARHRAEKRQWKKIQSAGVTEAA